MSNDTGRETFSQNQESRGRIDDHPHIQERRADILLDCGANSKSRGCGKIRGIEKGFNMRTCQFCGRTNLTNTEEICKGCGANLPAPLTYIPFSAKYDQDIDEVVIDYGGTGMARIVTTDFASTASIETFTKNVWFRKK